MTTAAMQTNPLLSAPVLPTLARLAAPNLYLLDEPTNHVDIAGRERLEAEILEHQATCVLVSHDRFFVRAVGTRFLRIDRARMREMDGPDDA